VIGSVGQDHSSCSVPLRDARIACVAGPGHERIKKPTEASTGPAAVEIQVPTGGLPYPCPGDVGGDSMAKKWGISKILLAAAVVAFVLAAVGMEIGDLNLIALGLALGFASFIV